MSVEVRLLGGFSVLGGDLVAIDGHWRPAKAAAIVKILALQPNHSLHRDRLIEALWPGTEPSAGTSSLYKNLHQLRSALEAAGISRDLVQLTRGRLVLDESADVDTDTFRLLAAKARTEQTSETLKAAINAYAGDLLPDDLYEEWTVGPREELRLEALGLRLSFAALLEKGGDFDEAMNQYRAALAIDKATEEAHRGLMRGHAANGRRDLALRQYELCRATLEEELELKPSTETMELAATIRAELPTPTRDSPRASAGTQSNEASPADNDEVLRTPFLGRSSEMKTLDASLRAMRDGSGSSILIIGEPGVGKSTLLQEFARSARALGSSVFEVCAPRTPREPYEVILDLIQAIHQEPGFNATAEQRERTAAIIDFLSGQTPPSGSGRDRMGGAQATKERLHDSLWRVLQDAALQQPLVLIIDDLQWMDAASREVLDTVSLRLSTHRLLLVAAERTDEPQPGTRGLAGRHTQLVLAGLNEAALAGIARAWIGYEAPIAFTRALLTRTGGNPFFVREVLTHLRDAGLVYRRGTAIAVDSSSIDAIGVTASVADVLGRRYFRLPASAREVLRQVSILGEASTQANLALQTGMDEESLRKALDVGIAAGWIQERDTTVLQFRHDLMRGFVYREIPDEDRQTFHARAASIMEAADPADEERHQLAAIATQLIAAGPAADPGKRLRFAQAAGDSAFSVFANEDAVKYWREALTIMEESLAPLSDQARLLERIGDATYVGDLDPEVGIAVLEHALRIYRDIGDADRAARIHSKLGARLAGTVGDFTQSDIPRALSHLHQAHELLAGRGDTVALGYLFVSMGSAYIWSNQAGPGLDAVTKALSIADSLRNARLRLAAMALLGHFLVQSNEPERGFAVTNDAWLAADEMDDAFFALLATFVLVSSTAQSAAEKIAFCERELAQERSANSPSAQATLHDLLAAQLVNAGQPDRARMVLAELGDRGFSDRQLLTHDGRWEEVQQILANEADRANRGGNRRNWVNARSDQAELALLIGERDRPRGIFEELVETDCESVSQVGHASALVELLALGRRMPEAESLLSRFETYFVEAPNGSLGAQCLRARAAVSAVGGSIESANRDFALALRLFTPRSYRSEAQTLRVWGASLAAAGATGEAAEKFEQAASVYRRVGAHARFLESLDQERRRASANAN